MSALAHSLFSAIPELNKEDITHTTRCPITLSRALSKSNLVATLFEFPSFSLVFIPKTYLELYVHFILAEEIPAASEKKLSPD